MHRLLRLLRRTLGLPEPNYRQGQLVELVMKGPRPPLREYVGIEHRRFQGDRWVYDGQLYKPSGDRIVRVTGIYGVREESLGLVVI